MFKNIKKHDALLVGGGVLLGTLGVKALTSKPAKKLYVQAVATGLRAKASYEASYIAKADAKPAEDACGCAGAAPAPVVA